jgi:outer membrane lipoprotein-sorting protein
LLVINYEEANAMIHQLYKTSPGLRGALLLVLCLTAPFALASEARAGDSPDPQALILSTRESFQSIQDYTATFIKQERINGKLREPELVLFKFQKPFKIYMKWTAGSKEGQEVLYVEGKNGGKVLAHPGFGGFLGGMLALVLPTFAISPGGPTAMKENLHPITNAGIGNIIENIIQNNNIALANNDLHLSIKGEAEVDGRPCIVIERVLPEENGYPAHRAQLYIDKTINLPVKLVLHDWSGQLLAQYEYTNLNLNPGLEPINFQRHNKDYRFGIAPPIIKD